MANQISGKVIALSKVTTVASADPSKAPMKKRELYIDCTRYDPYTGERSQYENKPLLEFGGDKVLEKLESLQLKAGDIVTVSFDIQGTPYKDNDGKTKVFTRVRCYDCEVRRRADGSVSQQAQVQQHAVQAPAPQPQAQAPMAQSPFPPEDAQGSDGLPF